MAKKPQNTTTTLEENINHLEEIAQNLESNNLSINTVLEAYKEASKILEQCKKEITEIEQSIIEVKNAN